MNTILNILATIGEIAILPWRIIFKALKAVILFGLKD